MNDAIYRTLFFCQKVDGVYRLFYGHAIFWKMSTLDYRVNGWKKRSIRKNIVAFFSDIDSKKDIDDLLSEGEILVSIGGKKEKIKFSWEENEEIFLSNDINEDGFKPFINLCSAADCYFSEVDAFDLDKFIKKNEESLSILENDFHVPLRKKPEILETFSVYTPARIEFFVRKVLDEQGKVEGFSLAVNDPFSDYQDCDVEFTISGDRDSEYFQGRFKVRDLSEKVKIDFDPDCVNILVKGFGDEVIYSEKSYFIKTVNVDMNIVTGNIKTSDGSVPVYKKESIEIKK